MRRRRFLASSASLVVFSGCVGAPGNSTGSTETRTESETTDERATESTDERVTEQFSESVTVSGEIRPAGNPSPPAEEFACATDEFTRHPMMYHPDHLEWGDTENVSLRIDSTAFEYGDTVHITLTNTTDSRLSIGLKQTFQIELFTENGWQDVRGKTGEGEVQYVDLGAEPPPGEVYEWSLRLTETGLVAGDKEFTVCPELVSGRYRFVYWSTGAPVAVAFDFNR